MVVTTFVLNARTRKLAAEAGDDFLVRMAHGFDAAMIGFLVSAQFITVLYYPYFWVGMPLTVMLYTAAREAAGVPFTSRGAGYPKASTWGPISELMARMSSGASPAILSAFMSRIGSRRSCTFQACPCSSLHRLRQSHELEHPGDGLGR